MTEEKKMLEFLNNKGIRTLEQLEAIFKPINNETAEEEVVFVKEITGPSISEEKINLLIEASGRNKEKLLSVLSKTVIAATAEASKLPEPNKVVEQSGIVADPGRVVVATSSASVVNAMTVASSPKKNTTSLPMRYRHKHTQQKNPYPKLYRSHQQQEKNRQAIAKQVNDKKMALGVNIQYNQISQCNQYKIQNEANQWTRKHTNQYTQSNHVHQQQNYNANALNHHTYQGVGQNISTGYNNATGYNNSTGYNNATGFGTRGDTIMGSQPLVSTPVYNTLQQQQWPAASPMAHGTGQGCYNNFGQFELGSQVQCQKSCAQYMMANRPMFDLN